MKRKVAVAGIRGHDGSYCRIPLFTSADVVHVFALAMGYKDEVAFSFGMISRSVPQVQNGEADLTIEQATKSIEAAGLLAQCRNNPGSVPTDPETLMFIGHATHHIHAIEACYEELISREPEVLNELREGYKTWLSEMNKVTKPGVFRRLLNLFKRNEQTKHA